MRERERVRNKEIEREKERVRTTERTVERQHVIDIKNYNLVPFYQPSAVNYTWMISS